MAIAGLYTEDILKDGFEQLTIRLKDSYDGKTVATIIRRLSVKNQGKAILYVHGFNDYFFQKEMASRFNDHGFNFYAIDLRRYGRSFLTNQKFNDIRNLTDYYEEILECLRIIRNEENKEIFLLGHSTGGLILTLFAKDYTGRQLFDGLILNSPFYDFNQSKMEKLLIPFASFVGKFFPNIPIPGGFSEEYGKSLHKSFGGEWEYNLDWKPNIPPKINLGWIRAIYKGQKKLKRPFSISEPILVLHSSDSTDRNISKEQASSTDIILNVEDINHIAHNIKGPLHICKIADGIHDLILSKEKIRDHVYSVIFDWIKQRELNI